ncbi:tetratricopeptide repeat protein [Streptomyces sp. NPDC047072]|uniref:tetratricopeptide repeat protein n=1 Tax=Streptomyces sp. NPDC047072 TaxID=3154809 RepID=UPI0033CBC953
MVVESVAGRARREFVERLCALRDAAHAKNADLQRASKRLVAERTVGVRELSTTRLSALLTGQLADAPDWDTVRTFVLSCARHATDHGVLLTPAETEPALWQRRLAALNELLRLLDRLDAEPPEATVPRALSTLPAAPSVFTGRDAELARLLDVLAPPTGDAPDVTVAAVAGMGGIGKTALALTAAQQALTQGWFTDIYSLNLRGYDPAPVTAHQALESLLRAMGTPPEDIPTAQEEREDLYRAVLAALARSDRRALILADNASDSAQLLPLLPGPGPHRLLTTSRHTHPRLVSHGAHLVDLTTLTPTAALALLHEVLHRAAPADRRVQDDRESTERLIALCGRIPLALHIAVGLLVLEPGRTVAGLTAELDGARSRLDHLDDGERALRATFDLSYHRLPPHLARLFRTLALNPGPDMGLPAVTALTDGEGHQLRAGLRELVRAHLLDSADERWSLHDLLRDYALHHAQTAPATEDPEDRAALLRLLKYYAEGAQAASMCSADPAERIAGEVSARFADEAQATAWLRAEHANLLAVPRTALDAGELDIARVVPGHLAAYLARGRYFDDRVSLATTAVTAARLADDPFDHAVALAELGQALADVRRYEEAERLLRTAVTALRPLGRDRATAFALNSLGCTLQDLRRLEEAMEIYTEAAELYLRLGDRHGYVDILNNQGNGLQELGRHREAVPLFQRAARLSAELGDDRRQAAVGLGLCNALRHEGRYEEAEAAVTAALGVLERLGDEYARAHALANRANVLLELGRTAESAHAFRSAADLFRELDDPRNEAKARFGLAEALAQAGEFGDAATAYRTAADTWHRLGDRYEEGRSRYFLGLTLLRTAEPAVAARELAEAGTAFTDAGAPGATGQVLVALAQLHQHLDHPDLARRAWLSAARAYEMAGATEAATGARRAAEGITQAP